MSYAVVEKEKMYFVGRIVRSESRNLDGRLITRDRVEVEGEGDWLKSAVEQKVLELNNEAA